MITHLFGIVRSRRPSTSPDVESATPPRREVVAAGWEGLESRVLFSAPYGGTPWPVPGLIQAENYDVGGEGVAYHDTTAANEGGMYRTSEGPDVADGALSDDGTYAVGWMRPGEWLQYTVNVPTAGTYTLGARVSSAVDTGQ